MRCGDSRLVKGKQLFHNPRNKWVKMAAKSLINLYYIFPRMHEFFFIYAFEAIKNLPNLHETFILRFFIPHLNYVRRPSACFQNDREQNYVLLIIKIVGVSLNAKF